MSDKINLLKEVAQLSDTEKGELLRLLGIHPAIEVVEIDPTQPPDWASYVNKTVFIYTPRNPAPPQEKPTDHFGQRLLAVLDTIPDDMKNDPAYADPVAWVKKARENDAPSTDGDDK